MQVAVAGADRKLTTDRDGAIKLLQAAGEAGRPALPERQLGRRREPSRGDDAFTIYLRAKAATDAAAKSRARTSPR